MSNKKNPKDLDPLRHSLSHLMTMAVLEIYPKAGLGVGPAIDDGFYQDYDLPEKISEDILPKLEKRMRELIKEKIDFVKTKKSFKDARKFYKHDPYKTEMIKDVEDMGEKDAWFYNSGDLENLCKGPHVKNTSEIDPTAFKLTRIAGAYWRGDEKKKMLTRIYGIGFENKAKLKAHLNLLKEAEKRNHRRLGTELELYSFHEESPGMVFLKPKGMIIWNELMKYWREVHDKSGYEETRTPIMLSRKLWEKSGHWDYYRENMYETKIDEMEYAIKPMNCPGGMLIYNEDIHSYRDLPLRWAEVGLVHRHELSGVLAGLFRVREFHQDDAHIFMRPDQVEKEVLGVIELVGEIYSTFGLTYDLELSTRPEKSIGTKKAWDDATKWLEAALKKTKQEYVVNEGDGAFYGPKIDFHIKDAIGRTWQCATIQLDMNLPERFDLNYTEQDGTKQRPVMIHRTVYGGIERFLGIIVEHYAGAFPVWLSPVQAMIIPVSDKFNKYGEEVKAQLKEAGIRAEIDESDESLGKRIRNSEKQKHPYVLVVGEKEVKDKAVAVRQRGKGDLGPQKVDTFIKKISKEITDKK